jgi:hypothetical protein
MEEEETLRGPTVNELERALDEVVTALGDHRTKSAGRPTLSFWDGDDEAVIQARLIAKDPVEYALKSMMTSICQLLFDALGSTGSVYEVAERVCDRDPKNWSRRMSPIDSAFDGIGRGDDMWAS